jgi:ubiquitin-like 1-activating enzyme E1 B
MIKASKLEKIYGQEIADKVQSAKVLVVGAGGIGCELVKCLSLTGFKHLSVIDLDTIDVSNLNRQFLFRRQHVDMPKSKTLKESICAQNPHI